MIRLGSGKKVAKGQTFTGEKYSHVTMNFGGDGRAGGRGHREINMVMIFGCCRAQRSLLVLMIEMVAMTDNVGNNVLKD